MIENDILRDILKDLHYICQLHEQAIYNHDKCREFSEILSELLIRLEDMKFYQPTYILTNIPINCKPTEALHCEKATVIESMIRVVAKDVQKK